MVNLFEAGTKFLAKLSERADGVQSATFNRIIGVKDSKTARKSKKERREISLLYIVCACAGTIL